MVQGLPPRARPAGEELVARGRRSQVSHREPGDGPVAVERRRPVGQDALAGQPRGRRRPRPGPCAGDRLAIVQVKREAGACLVGQTEAAPFNANRGADHHFAPFAVPDENTRPIRLEQPHRLGRYQGEQRFGLARRD